MSTHCWLRNSFLGTGRYTTRDRIHAALRWGKRCLFRAVPCRAEQNRTERYYTAGRDDVTRQHARFQGNAGKHSDLTQHSSHLARMIEGL
jgi:hypothetical protein